MRVIVTRPQPQASDWASRLGAAGVAAVALPLIEIAPPAHRDAVDAAWRGLMQQDLVVFVSPNAVLQFFQARPADVTWPMSTWAGSTGPGTSNALSAVGVPSPCIVQPSPDAAQFDSEALWSVLQPMREWRGARVLVVRGEGGRDWLAQTLQQRGAQVSFVEAYRRQAPSFDAAARQVLADAAAQPAGHLWLFSSSEAIGHLQHHAPAVISAQASAWGTHPRIVARAADAGFGHTRLVSATFDGLLLALGEVRAGAPAYNAPHRE